MVTTFTVILAIFTIHVLLHPSLNHKFTMFVNAERDIVMANMSTYPSQLILYLRECIAKLFLPSDRGKITGL